LALTAQEQAALQRYARQDSLDSLRRLDHRVQIQAFFLLLSFVCSAGLQKTRK
jgi:hypothetical protein